MVRCPLRAHSPPPPTHPPPTTQVTHMTSPEGVCYALLLRQQHRWISRDLSPEDDWSSSRAAKSINQQLVALLLRLLQACQAMAAGWPTVWDTL
jgi:hypothetical protein